MATINKTIFEKMPLTFGVDLAEHDDRLDCAWFNPVFENKIEKLQVAKNKNRKLTKLRIVAEVNGGKRLPKGTAIQESETDVIPYIRATDVKNLKVKVDSAAKISKEIHQGIQNYQLKKDDIVITIVGTIGEVGILENDVEVCDFTENIARIRTKDDSVLPRFLLHYLGSEFGRLQTERFSVGSLQYKLSLQSCRSIEVYLPSNNEQRKILDSVYLIFKEAEKHRKAGKRLISEARSAVVEKIGLPLIEETEKSRIFEVALEKDPFSRLDALFNNPLREKLVGILKKYQSKSLGKLIKPQKENKIVPGDYYRLVELKQIDENTGRITEFREVSELGSEKVLLKNGSILISKLQPKKGKIVIVSSEFDGCVGSNELLPFVLDSSEITLDYLWAVLRSDYVLKQWEHELTGSSRMRIGSNEIKNTIIPIPDLKLQKEIVNEIKNKLENADDELRKANELEENSKKLFEKLVFLDATN
ncbi:MAG: restriction endonuclease subunit S [Patescibacteria group bacterium]|nr:restriction endonuclease subunit S [Patescibacteria group bacterium]